MNVERSWWRESCLFGEGEDQRCGAVAGMLKLQVVGLDRDSRKTTVNYLPSLRTDVTSFFFVLVWLLNIHRRTCTFSHLWNNNIRYLTNHQLSLASLKKANQPARLTAISRMWQIHQPSYYYHACTYLQETSNVT